MAPSSSSSPAAAVENKQEEKWSTRWMGSSYRVRKSCWIWGVTSLTVSLVGGFILGWWKLMYQEEDHKSSSSSSLNITTSSKSNQKQQQQHLHQKWMWMVPFGLILLVTPLLISLALSISDFINNPTNPNASSSSSSSSSSSAHHPIIVVINDQPPPTTSLPLPATTRDNQCCRLH